MTGYRRAAVAIHGLGEEDRQWILAELPPADQAKLAQYLNELKDLGFEGNNSIANDVALPYMESHTLAQPPEQLRYATSAEMYSILENEPSSLIAQVIAMENWPWADGFLKMFHPVRQGHIHADVKRVTEVSPARKAFLLEAISKRLQTQKKSNAGSNISVMQNTFPSVFAGHVSRIFSSFTHLVLSWKR